MRLIPFSKFILLYIVSLLLNADLAACYPRPNPNLEVTLALREIYNAPDVKSKSGARGILILTDKEECFKNLYEKFQSTVNQYSPHVFTTSVNLGEKEAGQDIFIIGAFTKFKQTYREISTVALVNNITSHSASMMQVFGDFVNKRPSQVPKVLRIFPCSSALEDHYEGNRARASKHISRLAILVQNTSWTPTHECKLVYSERAKSALNSFLNSSLAAFSILLGAVATELASNKSIYDKAKDTLMSLETTLEGVSSIKQLNQAFSRQKIGLESLSQAATVLSMLERIESIYEDFSSSKHLMVFDSLRSFLQLLKTHGLGSSLKHTFSQKHSQNDQPRFISKSFEKVIRKGDKVELDSFVSDLNQCSSNARDFVVFATKSITVNRSITVLSCNLILISPIIDFKNAGSISMIGEKGGSQPNRNCLSPDILPGLPGKPAGNLVIISSKVVGEYNIRSRGGDGGNAQIVRNAKNVVAQLPAPGKGGLPGGVFIIGKVESTNASSTYEIGNVGLCAEVETGFNQSAFVMNLKKKCGSRNPPQDPLCRNELKEGKSYKAVACHYSSLSEKAETSARKFCETKRKPSLATVNNVSKYLGIYANYALGFSNLNDDWIHLNLEDFTFSPKILALIDTNDLSSLLLEYAEGFLFSRQNRKLIGRISQNIYDHVTSLLIRKRVLTSTFPFSCGDKGPTCTDISITSDKSACLSAGFYYLDDKFCSASTVALINPQEAKKCYDRQRRYIRLHLNGSWECTWISPSSTKGWHTLDDLLNGKKVSVMNGSYVPKHCSLFFAASGKGSCSLLPDHLISGSGCYMNYFQGKPRRFSDFLGNYVQDCELVEKKGDYKQKESKIRECFQSLRGVTQGGFHCNSSVKTEHTLASEKEIETLKLIRLYTLQSSLMDVPFYRIGAEKAETHLAAFDSIPSSSPSKELLTNGIKFIDKNIHCVQGDSSKVSIFYDAVVTRMALTNLERIIDVVSTEQLNRTLSLFFILSELEYFAVHKSKKDGLLKDPLTAAYQTLKQSVASYEERLEAREKILDNLFGQISQNRSSNVIGKQLAEKLVERNRSRKESVQDYAKLKRLTYDILNVTGHYRDLGVHIASVRCEFIIGNCSGSYLENHTMWGYPGFPNSGVKKFFKSVNDLENAYMMMFQGLTSRTTIFLKGLHYENQAVSSLTLVKNFVMDMFQVRNSLLSMYSWLQFKENDRFQFKGVVENLRFALDVFVDKVRRRYFSYHYEQQLQLIYPINDLSSESTFPEKRKTKLFLQIEKADTTLLVRRNFQEFYEREFPFADLYKFETPLINSENFSIDELTVAPNNNISQKIVTKPNKVSNLNFLWSSVNFWPQLSNFFSGKKTAFPAQVTNFPYEFNAVKLSSMRINILVQNSCIVTDEYRDVFNKSTDLRVGHPGRSFYKWGKHTYVLGNGLGIDVTAKPSSPTVNPNDVDKDPKMVPIMSWNIEDKIISTGSPYTNWLLQLSKEGLNTGSSAMQRLVQLCDNVAVELEGAGTYFSDEDVASFGSEAALNLNLYYEEDNYSSTEAKRKYFDVLFEQDGTKYAFSNMCNASG